MELSYQLEDFSCDLEELQLLKKLKGLAKFWSHAPEETNKPAYEWRYNDLALLLASCDFITHASIAVKLLTAYNLAQVLRIRQSKHPYDNEQLNNILLFLINELQKFNHERIDASKYQERILEILVSQEVILVFCNLTELEQVIVNVYKALLNAAHPEMSLTTKEGMIKLVGSLVEHSPNVPLKMLQMIFLNCQSRVQMSNRLVYDINVAILSKYGDTLGPAIEKVLFGEFLATYSCHVALNDDPTSTLEDLRHSLSRLWKLHGICSGVTIPILRNLESLLYTMPHECRHTLMIFLGKLFSNPSNVDLHKNCSSLWEGFLGRFNDIKVEIRLSCLNLVPELFQIEALRTDLVSAIGKRKMDRVTSVRNKLVLLVFMLLRDSHVYPPEIVSELSKILENSLLDHEVRSSGLRSMAELYDKFAHQGRDYLPILKEVEKYPEYILKLYWSYEKEYKKERLTVIQLLNRYLLPYSLPPDQRMKRFLKVLSTLDPSSCSTLATIKYDQYINCQHLLGIIKAVKEDSVEKITLMNISAISHDVPLPLQAAKQSVTTFLRKLSEDGPEVEAINSVLTHKSVRDIGEILESFKENKKDTDEFTWIFELCSDWLLDEGSFKVLLSYIDDVIRGRTDLCDELNLVEFPLENVFTMLKVLSASCLSSFHDQQLISTFISWFRISGDRDLKLIVLKILAALQSEDEELMAKYPKVMDELILICQDACSKSDTELAKWSIKSLLIAEPMRKKLSEYLLSVVMDLAKDMTSSDLHRKYCSIYYLGYISLYMGTYFKDAIGDVLSKQVINKVMSSKESSGDASSISFSSPSICMKIKARYLKFLGQYAYEGGIPYEEVFNLLFGVIESGGESPASGSPRSGMEAWMRLFAGCAVLRVLRGGTMNMLSCREFYLLSGLMNDELPEVRELFFKKLQNVLHFDYPKISLPPELLSMLVMADIEDGEESGILSNMRYLFSMKLKFLTLHMEIEPFSDFDPHRNEILVYGLLALSHSKIFTAYNDLEQLKKVKTKLKILLDFLLTDENIDLAFYRKQVEKTKSHKLKDETEDFTKKLWVLCDIALLLMRKRSVRAARVAREPTLPEQFFEPEAIKNSRNYLSKKAAAELFVEGNQGDGWGKTEDEEEEASANESDATEGDMDSLVVIMGEGTMATEGDSDDETPYHAHEESTYVPESPLLRRSSRKRKLKMFETE